MEWGLYEVSHTERELIDLFENHPEVGSSFKRLTEVTGSKIFLDDLVNAGLLCHTGQGRNTGFRSRFSESIRLFVSLRQRFRSDDWDTAPELVSEAKFHLSPRRFPVRDVSYREVVDVLDKTIWQKDIQERVLSTLLDQHTKSPLLLAPFQKRAIQRILGNYQNTQRSTGTVVTAGTGGGKTKAFYIPALMGIAADIKANPTASCKVLGVYPRNVLLSDQFSEVVGLISGLYVSLKEQTGRSIRVGCLNGAVPYNTHFASPPNKAPLERWVQVKNGRRTIGYKVPFLQDRNTGRSFVWLDEDRERGRTCLYYEDDLGQIAVEDGIVCLTRDQLIDSPPDILLTSSEMLNKELSSPLGRKVFGFATGKSSLRLLLLDEVHTYEGFSGAQIPWVLRRLAYWTGGVRGSTLQVVGLSATLEDATGHLSTLTGLSEENIEEIKPSENSGELTIEGQEYNIALKSHPGSGAGPLSTSIQTVMLGARLLSNQIYDSKNNIRIDAGYFYGHKLFGFGDNLDTVHRWYRNFLNADRTLRLPRLRQPDWNPATHQYSPNDEVRWSVGQSWRLPSDLGHDLNNSLQVNLTTAESPGVNSTSTVVLATSALEVGFDDNQVGMIVQHKSPISMASFVQRRGRAGRRRGMRPWTVIVLSDLGRDRWAFRDSEKLFYPILDRIRVPIFNPYILRVQATWFLVDWIASKVNSKDPPNLYLSRRKYFNENAKLIVNRLLTEKSKRDEFTSDLVKWLNFSKGGPTLTNPEDFANRVLWDPPKSIFRQVLPALWNHLNGDEKLGKGEKPPLLAGFLPPASFEIIGKQTLEIYNSNSKTHNYFDLERALNEFAPGRVSRRFVSNPKRPSEWLRWSPSLLNGQLPDTVPVDQLFSSLDRNEDWETYTIYIPNIVEVDDVPTVVKDMSNASWNWKSLTLGIGDGRQVGFDTGPLMRSIFDPGSVWLHRENRWIQFYRLSTNFRFDIHRQRLAPVRGSVKLVPPVNDQPNERTPAIGYVQHVDAIKLPIRKELIEFTPELTADEVSSLRPYFVRYLAYESLVLKQAASEFQISSLVTSALGMISATSRLRRLPLSQAWSCIVNKASAADKVLRTIIMDEMPSDEDPNSFKVNVREICDLWNDPLVADEMNKIMEVLWVKHDKRWFDWLVLVGQETLRSSIENVVQSILPDVPDSDFRVEVISDDSNSSIWILEGNPGGIGVIDRLLSEASHDPLLFDVALDRALKYCAAERNTLNISSTLSCAMKQGSSVYKAFKNLRDSNSYKEIEIAKGGLIDALKVEDLNHDKGSVVSLLSKALSPGSSPKSDRWLSRLTKAHELFSSRIGLSIDHKVWSYCVASSRFKDSAFRTLEGMLGLAPTDQQVNVFVRKMTLIPCVDSCPECLGAPRELQGILASRRFIKKWLELEKNVCVIECSPDRDWQSTLIDSLRKYSEIKLIFQPSLCNSVSSKVISLLSERYDREYTLSTFRIVSITRKTSGWELVIRVDDMESL